jgi:hypothetical protein
VWKVAWLFVGQVAACLAEHSHCAHVVVLNEVGRVWGYVREIGSVILVFLILIFIGIIIFIKTMVDYVKIKSIIQVNSTNYALMYWIFVMIVKFEAIGLVEFCNLVKFSLVFFFLIIWLVNKVCYFCNLILEIALKERNGNWATEHEKYNRLIT